MSHTKGPWKYDIKKEKRYCSSTGNQLYESRNTRIFSGNDEFIAVVGSLNESQEMANARLIAAAPEMLERLYEALAYVSQDGKENFFVENLKKTIDKAEGKI